jgi:hypothetical protein
MQTGTKILMLLLGWTCCISIAAIAKEDTSEKNLSGAEEASVEPDSPPVAIIDSPDAGLESDGGQMEVDGGDDAGQEPVVAETNEAEPDVAKDTETAEVDLSQYPEAGDGTDEEEEDLPFAKGDMEAGLGFGLAGNGDVFYLGVGLEYAYYVIDRLAPGISLLYTHIFSDQEYTSGNSSFSIEYPDSFRILPFLKFVIMRSRSVAPYIIVTGGYEFEWGGDTAVNAGILGGGAGVHVGLGKHVAINIELLGLHYWYEETKIYGFTDGTLPRHEVAEGELGDTYWCPECDNPLADDYVATDDDFVVKAPGTDGKRYNCTNGDNNCEYVDDDKDQDREWHFPLITIGVSFFF